MTRFGFGFGFGSSSSSCVLTLTLLLLLLALTLTLPNVNVVNFVDASTGASLDQAGQTIDGLVDQLQILKFDTPNDCILHVINPIVGNTVSIESDPPTLTSEFGFLVDENANADGSGPTFLLQYENPNTSGQSGTITINIPLDRPTDLVVSGRTKILLQDGFLGLRKIQLSDDAQINGYMTSSEASRVQLFLEDQSLLRLDVGDDLVVEIDQHSDQATSERVLTARAVDSSTLELIGDVTSIRCEDTSNCKVDGSLTRDPTVDNSGALSPTATFTEGVVTIDTSTTTSGSTCTNGPNPTISTSSNNNTPGVTADSNDDISSGSNGRGNNNNAFLLFSSIGFSAATSGVALLVLLLLLL